ncbi:hypothetical protein ACQ4PT_017227 [Festuca glaucescens]
MAAELSREERWSLAGATALVTGGSKGIGHAIVEELAGFGARVHTCSRNAAELEDSRQRWEEKGMRVTVSVCDVSVRAEREKLMETVKETFHGKLDVLVNNAGQLLVKAAAECTADEYSHLMATNLESFFHLSQLARPLLLNASGGGSIVNMSSIGGTISYAGAAIYNVTKGAINQLTRSLATEWAPDKIRVNGVAPGFVTTDMIKDPESNLQLALVQPRDAEHESVSSGANPTPIMEDDEAIDEEDEPTQADLGALEHDPRKRIPISRYAVNDQDRDRTKSSGGDSFVKHGFRNWNMKPRLTKLGSAHAEAQEKYDMFTTPSASIKESLASNTSQYKALYKLRLTWTLKYLRFLLRQGLAFRGHDESEDSLNKGNFLELLNWLARNFEEVDKVVLNNAPQNCKMTHHDIQHELINCCAQETTKIVIEDLDGGQFAILADESIDVYQNEQLDVCLRYVDRKGRAVVRFIGVAHVEDTTSLTLKEGQLKEYHGAEAQAALSVLTSFRLFEFVFMTHLMQEIFGYTDDLSRALQMKEQDIVHAIELVDLTKYHLEGLRSDPGWDDFLMKI